MEERSIKPTLITTEELKASIGDMKQVSFNFLATGIFGFQQAALEVEKIRLSESLKEYQECYVDMKNDINLLVNLIKDIPPCSDESVNIYIEAMKDILKKWDDKLELS